VPPRSAAGARNAPAHITARIFVIVLKKDSPNPKSKGDGQDNREK